MAAAVGSSSFFSFSGSAAEIIPAETTIAITTAAMTAAAAAERPVRIRYDLTDNAEEPYCCGSRLYSKKIRSGAFCGGAFFCISGTSLLPMK